MLESEGYVCLWEGKILQWEAEVSKCDPLSRTISKGYPIDWLVLSCLSPPPVPVDSYHMNCVNFPLIKTRSTLMRICLMIK